MCLNMGHTIGHVIETLPPAATKPTPPRPLRHGEAVGLGLIAEAACGETIGATTPGTSSRIQTALARFGLPTRLSTGHNPERLVDAMLDDKKVSAGQIRLAVPTGEGTCLIIKDPPRAAILAGIASICA
jgi:3-dehydroquinate synthase